MLVQARTQSRQSSNKMLLWANAYDVQNRVDVRNLDLNYNRLAASQICLASYLPTTEDYATLHDKMTTLVSRILVCHITHFKERGRTVQWHIPYGHSTEAAEKSNLAICRLSALLMLL
jgi:hypothetical protein